MALKDAKAKENGEDSGEVTRLKKELARKEKDVEALKSQCEGLQREYNRLGDESAGKTGGNDTPKKDL
ncbi:hypothetical protein KEM55_007418 [Ascosphaera atra]|nr:hypothetical protein KEM55_007418 [Ascosphaera atra]